MVKEKPVHFKKESVKKMENENLTREEMLAFLVAFGRLVPEYYERLDDEKLKREYEEERRI
ncbi:hypothetical protein U2I53_10670 [Lysinibacillus capsici]